MPCPVVPRVCGLCSKYRVLARLGGPSSKLQTVVEDVQGTEIDEADLDGPGTWYVYAGKGGSSKTWANHPAVQAGEIRHAPCPRLEYRAQQGEAAGETESSQDGFLNSVLLSNPGQSGRVLVPMSDSVPRAGWQAGLGQEAAQELCCD